MCVCNNYHKMQYPVSRLDIMIGSDIRFENSAIPNYGVRVKAERALVKQHIETSVWNQQR